MPFPPAYCIKGVRPLPETKAKKGVLRRAIKAVLALVCTVLSVGMLCSVALSAGTACNGTPKSTSDAVIMDKYDMYMTNQISTALDGILSIKKVYWLSDSDLVAPEPDPSGYGEASSQEELLWLLDEAADLIGDQEMIFFSEGRNFYKSEKIRYYYDETILVIVWKEIINRCGYTLAEVKIADPSQFRRFLAGGEFGSDKQYVTTEMSASVNAVVATSGDFYKFRRSGIVVYDGQLQRFAPKYADTCFITESGDLLFSYRQEMKSEEEAIQFIEDNHVRFSLVFGPVLIDGSEVVAPESYGLGEINEEYSRSAICQADELHYLIVNQTQVGKYMNRRTIQAFAQDIRDHFGVEKAYALDGGQTTVITLDDELMTRPDYGYQRAISDIIYFATAIPDGE